MRLILILGNIFCILTISDSFVKSNSISDDNDPGEALYLTKYIESGNIENARQLALVQMPNSSVKSYAGYFTVNKTFNSNLFFWFFPAKYDPESAPVVLWLQGGPGASSLLGLFAENGPFSIDSKLNLVPAQYSWHLNHNLIYIDNPVGTGFSFTDSDDGYANNEVDVGQNLLIALQQFFLLFPKLQSNEFFVSGESYAGKYVPAIGYAIYQDSKRESVDLKKPKINLKGLAVGNGLSDPIHQYDYADYLYQLGLIDTNGRDLFTKLQNLGLDCMKRADLDCAFEAIDQLILGNLQTSLFTNLTGFKMYTNFLKTKEDEGPSIGAFLEQTVIRRAIHVGNNSFNIDGDNIVQLHLKYDMLATVAPWVAELLSHYRILIYTGQLDIVCAYPLVENYLKNLKFSGADEYKSAERHIWRVDNEIAGYVKHAENLTEVLVRNAGHMVPMDQPKRALDMIQRFTSHKNFY